jgi:Uma2 family endonuclease
MNTGGAFVEAEPKRHKLNVHDYYRLAEVGILDESSRVELIEGELIDMAPIGSNHAGVVNGLARALFAACGDRAVVAVQNPVRLDEFNEPQPDFAVLRPRADLYRARHPAPADVLLLIEVANSSLRFDRNVKLPLYARAGIPELWIVDLGRRVVESFRGPSQGAYGPERTYREGERVTLASAPHIEIALTGVFG